MMGGYGMFSVLTPLAFTKILALPLAICTRSVQEIVVTCGLPLGMISRAGIEVTL